uniref:Uncharacterized protein n=1 Tax=Setaria viridis TaxID=4556 RepID=A0A4U6TTC9_SETVI|nr:hypothetical protein SEVIR_8G143600v2 [Setaria viridis]
MSKDAWSLISHVPISQPPRRGPATQATPLLRALRSPLTTTPPAWIESRSRSRAPLLLRMPALACRRRPRPASLEDRSRRVADSC